MPHIAYLMLLNIATSVIEQVSSTFILRARHHQELKQIVLCDREQAVNIENMSLVWPPFSVQTVDELRPCGLPD